MWYADLSKVRQADQREEIHKTQAEVRDKPQEGAKTI